MPKYQPKVIFFSGISSNTDTLIFDIKNFDAVKYTTNAGIKYELNKNDDGSFMLLKENIYIKTIRNIYKAYDVDSFTPIIYGEDSSLTSSDYLLISEEYSSEDSPDYILTYYLDFKPEKFIHQKPTEIEKINKLEFVIF
jgi:hypothetical protein